MKGWQNLKRLTISSVEDSQILAWLSVVNRLPTLQKLTLLKCSLFDRSFKDDGKLNRTLVPNLSLTFDRTSCSERKIREGQVNWIRFLLGSECLRFLHVKRPHPTLERDVLFPASLDLERVEIEESLTDLAFRSQMIKKYPKVAFV